MSNRSDWLRWSVVPVGLVVLFVATYIETSDWMRAVVPVLSLVTLISLIVAIVSILLIFTARRPMTTTAYTAVGIGLAGLLLLPMFGVPINRLAIFAALAAFVAIIFVAVDWLKGKRRK